MSSGELPLAARPNSTLQEQLPQHALIRFVDDHNNIANPQVTLYLEDAIPNAFPDGPVSNYLGCGKAQGYEVGGQLGDPLTDRIIPGDGHRFHDGGHIGIEATVGSATLRDLFNVNRRSWPEIAITEDGPRPALQEESFLESLSQELSEPGAKAATVIRGLSHRAAAEMARHLRSGRTISAEQWREAFTVGHCVMMMLQTTIGEITDADRTPIDYSQPPEDVAMQQQTKLHTAWLHLDKEEGEVHFSTVSGEHAMSGRAMKIRQLVRKLAASREQQANDPHRPVVMGIVDGVAYGFRRSDFH